MSDYRNKHIVVTGAAGYLGSQLIKRLSSTPCNIIALDMNPPAPGTFSGGKAAISFCQADIRAGGVWRKLLKKVDLVFHFAAQTSSKAADANPALDIETNLLPVVALIEACQKNDFSPDIVFSGTVTEVGFTDTYPVDETFRDLPLTVYDINKLAAEKYLQYYSNQLGRRAVTLRLSNVYGPGPPSRRSDRGILNLMVRKAIRGEPLTLFGEGSFVRDYSYIDDVVKAFLLAGAEMDVLKGNYYLIGSGVGHTMKEALHLIKKVVARKTGRKVEILRVPVPKNCSQIEYRNFVADSSKFSALTGWKAEVSLPEGISQTVDYLLEEG